MSDIGERVKKIVVEHLGSNPTKSRDSASFIDDLGADSLDTVELVMAFEEEFGCEIPDDAAETILTVGDAVKFLEKNAKILSFSVPLHPTLCWSPRDPVIRRDHTAVPSAAGAERCRAPMMSVNGFAGARRKRSSADGDVQPGIFPRNAGRLNETCRRYRHGHGHAARLRRRAVVAAAPRRGERRPQGRHFRRFRPAEPDRLHDPARRRQRRHVQPRPLDGAEGTAQGRRFHRVTPCARRARRSRTAGARPKTYDEQIAIGVLIGSGIGGIGGIADTAIVLKERGPRRVSPFFIPGRLINLASGYVSIAHGLKGPNHAVVTACSTGAHAIGDAARLIALGDAELMVAGGAESPINRLSMAGFAACRALSTGFNDDPTRASRPYDRDRDGFVIAEGAGVVVLEEFEHARGRNADIYAELVGYGMSGDAHHVTAPAPDGDGAYRCMAAALRRAGITPAEIDYINGHGTSTPVGDEIELSAVHRLVGNAARAHFDVLDQIVHGPPSWRGRGGRGDLLDSRDARRSRTTDHQSGPPVGGHRHRPCAVAGEAAHHRYRAVELFRVRRHQCIAGVSALRRLTLRTRDDAAANDMRRQKDTITCCKRRQY